MKELDLKDFAIRVERVCDFFLDQVKKEQVTDSLQDIKVLQTLKEEAADIQYDNVQIITQPLQGLHNFMHGI